MVDPRKGVIEKRRDTLVNIVTRTAWDALPPRAAQPSQFPHERVFFTCTKGPFCHIPDECVTYVQELQIQDMDVFRHDDIKYNFLIGGDGRVYEGRGWTTLAHTDPKRQPALDIAYIGTYQKGKCPTQKMEDAARDLLSYGQHRQFLVQDQLHETQEWC